MGRGGLPKDDREAVRLYKLAAAQGNAAAQINLGGFYERGLGGLAKDDQEAARLYKLAADRGNAAARAFLARLPARARDAADIGGRPSMERFSSKDSCISFGGLPYFMNGMSLTSVASGMATIFKPLTFCT